MDGEFSSHQDRIVSQSTLNRKHRLVVYKGRPQSNAPEETVCRVCRGLWPDPGIGLYHCLDCGLVVHDGCRTAVEVLVPCSPHTDQQPAAMSIRMESDQHSSISPGISRKDNGGREKIEEAPREGESEWSRRQRILKEMGLPAEPTAGQVEEGRLYIDVRSASLKQLFHESGSATRRPFVKFVLDPLDSAVQTLPSSGDFPVWTHPQQKSRLVLVLPYLQDATPSLRVQVCNEGLVSTSVLGECKLRLEPLFDMPRASILRWHVLESRHLGASKASTLSKILLNLQFRPVTASTQSPSHIFRIKTYYTPTWCDVCGGVIMGVVRQGFHCAKCGINVHKNCRLQAEVSVPVCAAPPSQDAEEQVVKKWRSDSSDSVRSRPSSAVTSHISINENENHQVIPNRAGNGVDAEMFIGQNATENRERQRPQRDNKSVNENSLGTDLFPSSSENVNSSDLRVLGGGGRKPETTPSTPLSQPANKQSTFTFPNGSSAPSVEEIETDLSEEGGQTGTLRLRITSAHICTARCRESWHERSHGTIGPDCYITLDFEGIQLTSQTIYKTSNPKFNEKVAFKVGSPRSFLSISVHNMETGKLIGMMRVSIFWLKEIGFLQHLGNEQNNLALLYQAGPDGMQAYKSKGVNWYPLHPAGYKEDADPAGTHSVFSLKGFPGLSRGDGPVGMPASTSQDPSFKNEVTGYIQIGLQYTERPLTELCFIPLRPPDDDFSPEIIKRNGLRVQRLAQQFLDLELVLDDIIMWKDPVVTFSCTVLLFYTTLVFDGEYFLLVPTFAAIIFILLKFRERYNGTFTRGFVTDTYKKFTKMKGSVGYLKVAVLKGRNLSFENGISTEKNRSANKGEGEKGPSEQHDEDERELSGSVNQPRDKRMIHVEIKYEPAPNDTRYSKANPGDLIIGRTRSVPISKNPLWIVANPMLASSTVEKEGEVNGNSKAPLENKKKGPCKSYDENEHSGALHDIGESQGSTMVSCKSDVGHYDSDEAAVEESFLNSTGQMDQPSPGSGSTSAHPPESVGLMQRLVHKSYAHSSKSKVKRDSANNSELLGRRTVLESWHFYNVNGVRVCVTNAFKYPVLQSLVYSKLKGFSMVLPWDASPASIVFEVAVSKRTRRTIVRQLGVTQPENSQSIIGIVKVPFSDFVKARLGNRLNPIQRWYKIYGGPDGTAYAGEILIRLQVDLRQATEEICRNITGKEDGDIDINANGGNGISTEGVMPWVRSLQARSQRNPIGSQFRHNPLRKLFFFQKSDSVNKLKRREREVLEQYITIHNETIEEMILSGGRRTGMMGQFYTGLETTKQIQNMMGNICGKFESFQNWLNWTDPERTFGLLFALSLMSMTILWTIRSRYIILFSSLFHLSWGLYRKLEALSNGYIQIRRTGKLSYSRRLFNFVCGTIPHNEDLRQTYQLPNRMFRLERNEIQWRMRHQAIWHGWLYVREGDVDDGGKFDIRHVIIRSDRILWWKSLADVDQHASEPCGSLRLNETSCIVQATKVEEQGAIAYTLPLCVMGVRDVDLQDDAANAEKSASDPFPLSIPMQSRKVFLARTVQEKDSIIECLNSVFRKLRER